MRFKKTLFLASAICVPLIIGGTAPKAVRAVRTSAISLATPLFNSQAEVAYFFKSTFRALLEFPKLEKQKQKLEREIEQLKGQSMIVSELKQENERLSRLLDLKGKITSSSKATAARLIARDPSQWSQYIIINKGLKDGVRVDTVLVHPSGLVGKVVVAGVHSARAIELVDRQSRVVGMNERTRDIGLVEGTGTSLLKMTYLDRDSKIQVGDIIISSGFGGIYPKGIPIGRVEQVAEEQDHLTLYAIVEPFVSFSKLEEVLCVSS